MIVIAMTVAVTNFQLWTSEHTLLLIITVFIERWVFTEMKLNLLINIEYSLSNFLLLFLLGLRSVF